MIDEDTVRNDGDIMAVCLLSAFVLFHQQTCAEYAIILNVISEEIAVVHTPDKVACSRQIRNNIPKLKII